jgi:hypothetical protein
MTKQLGYQVEIFNKEEALEHFKSSNYEDCRINAYPSFTEYHGINRTPISFFMVDLASIYYRMSFVQNIFCSRRRRIQ